MTCEVCPHPADCSASQCLVDRAAPLMACNQFSRWMLPEQARRFEAALRDGRTLRRITGGGRFGPPICGLSKFRVHCDAYPAWGAQMKALAKANARAADLLKGHNRGKTHCIRGHDLSNARVHIHKGQVKRECRQCQNMHHKRGGVAPPEVVEEVKARINCGETISAIAGGRGEKGRIITHGTFTRLRREDAEFDKLVVDRMALNPKRLQFRRFYNPENRHSVKRAETNDYYKIRAMTPANLPANVRDDLTQEAFLGLLEGRIARDGMRAAMKKLLTAHYKMHPFRYGPMSLDAPAFRDGATPLIETISQGIWN